MSGGQEWTVTLGTGTSLIHDGELWTVTGLDGRTVVLRGRAGRGLRVHTATLLASPGTRIIGAREDLPAAAKPVLDDLTVPEQEQLAGRLGHVRELLTGYVSGTAGTAAEGEPRPQFDPSLPAGEREATKAAELGVSARTVRRWVAGYLRAGAGGLVDGRSVRPSDVLAGVDERWLAMCWPGGHRRRGALTGRCCISWPPRPAGNWDAGRRRSPGRRPRSRTRRPSGPGSPPSPVLSGRRAGAPRRRTHRA